ncbi:VWA domain-containing protein, partial [Dolichospermum sp. ST_sed3]|nr:VWA domain-containing protein [Dolichospermum sp. ST_sed3]
VYSQTISLFEIDKSNFPNIKAKFIIFNKDGTQYYPILSELNITENGIKRSISRVSCPEPQPPKALSSVLVMDLSSSMESGRVGSRNIDLAKAAARAWVEGLKLGISECAITGFNDKSYLIRDFTTDKEGLLDAINSLQPDGNTDYNAAFYDAPSSGLQISKKGKFQKIIVMLTDGMPNDPPNVSGIISIANNQNCRIYAVTLGMFCPKALKDIATQTGGLWFENISSQEQAENVYRMILNTAQGSSPCEIEWTSDVSCELSTTIVRLRRDFDSCKASYYPPEDAASRITISPRLINFGIILPGTFKDTTVTLRAINSDYKIDSIKILKGSQNFSFVNPGFPVVIPMNQSHKFTLRYAPTDNKKSYTTIEIESQPCKAAFNVSGGMNEIEIPPTLTLTKPKGGETYIVGSDTLITWNGIGSEEKVSLDYSFDNGNNWKNITDTASGLKYKWENIPKPASTECLVKVRQNELSALDTAYYKLLWKSIISNPMRIEWNPDGSMIAISSYNGGLTILDNEYKLLLEPFGSNYSYFEISKNIAWINGGPCIAEAYQYQNEDSIYILDLITHTVINSFVGGNSRNITSITWNPDFTKIASVTYDGTISIWDAANGNLFSKFKPKSTGVNCLAWSSDGTKIAAGYYDTTITIYNVANGTIINTLKGHLSTINDIAWCPNDNKIVSASTDRTLIIWDINSGKELFSLGGHSDKVNSVNWNFDGSKIASGSDDQTIKIWDASTGAEITTFTSDHAVNCVAWSPDGKKNGSVLSYYAVQIWDVLTEKTIKTIIPHRNSVNCGTWSPDYSKIATGSYDGTVKIWEAEDGNLINTIDVGYNIDKAIWSPDGTQIAIRSKNTGIDIYDAMTGTLVKNTCDSINYYIKNFLWSPDGTKFAIYTSENNIKIWDINKDQFILTYDCNGADIKCLYWSPDGIKVAAHFADSYFKIWDIS